MDIICYGGSHIKPLGCLVLPVTHSGKVFMCDFIVVESGEPLLGLRSCSDLGLIQLNSSANQVSSSSDGNNINKTDLCSLLHQFEILFDEDLGFIHGVEAHIQLKRDAEPRFVRNRAVPLALREKMNNAIDATLQRGSIRLGVSDSHHSQG